MVARSSALRQALAAVLLVVLTLSGVGRAMAMADISTLTVETIAGVTVHICHDDGGDPTTPSAPSGHHDCCDACALCAPVSVPDAAPFVAPGRVEHFADHAEASTWTPAVARVPTPRLSQGPPTA